MKEKKKKKKFLTKKNKEKNKKKKKMKLRFKQISKLKLIFNSKYLTPNRCFSSNTEEDDLEKNDLVKIELVGARELFFSRWSR